MPNMGDRECGTTADNDAAISGDGSERGKITKMSKHVSRSPGVHVPITTSSVGAVCSTTRSAGSQGAGGMAGEGGGGAAGRP